MLTSGGVGARLRDHAITLALLLAVTVPFSGKAFHIDDAFYLAIARNIERQPLRPYDGAVALDDTDHRVFAARGASANTFETLSHPPLVPYVIAGVAWVAGGLRERPEHLVFIVFPLFAAYFQYRLGARFTGTPLWATLGLTVAPIFVLGSHGLMTDVPALALSLGSLALFVEGMDSGRPARLVGAGVLAGLAIVTRYVALGLVPLAAAYVVLQRAPARRAGLALLPLLAVVGAWSVQNLLVHGAIHVEASARHYAAYYAGRYFSAEEIAWRAFGDVASLGGTSIPLAVLFATSSRGALFRLLAVAGAAVAAVALATWVLPAMADYSPRQLAALAACLAAGSFLVVEAFRRASRDGDGRFLAVWLAGGLLGTIVLLPFAAARYMLTVLPPLILLLFSGPPLPRPRPAARVAAIAASAALALALAVADYEYAGAYRTFAGELTAAESPRRVWFLGDWGFRYYMETAGHRYLLSTDDTPGEGDIVVRPRTAALHSLSRHLSARVETARTVDVQGHVPLRLMNEPAKAGFYSHGWGLLPFAFSRAPLEAFEVLRVHGER